jgi:HD-GYP domain-containing protein (c-di-GMP phosphodiesterase class II)
MKTVGLEFERIRKLTQISIALSTQHDIDRLLEMIVEEARWLTRADGGTLYILSDDGRHLNFAIVQNESLRVRMGGTGGEITWPPIPMHLPDGRSNDQNVSAYAALSGRTVNIEDVYTAAGFDFQGTRHFDQETGYRSRSMLVVPMYNHEQDIIGVLQLLNAVDAQTGEVVGFSDESEKITEAMASQAAVALTNRRLIQSLQHLLDAFITAIATTIDEKSPYTGGHVRRVADLVVRLARRVNEAKIGPFADVAFDADQMEELRMAAWLHDIGKITTPEHIVDKATRLETIVDRLELIRTRAEVIKRDHLIGRLRDRLAAAGLGTGADPASAEDPFLRAVEEDLDLLAKINGGETRLDDALLSRLKAIGERRGSALGGGAFPMVTKDEMRNLRIARGTLTDEERSIVNQHALMTEKILQPLPFPKKFRNVPEYAASHHEKLDGSGYPHGKRGDALALQSRIIAVADVYEALTARDRPYKTMKTREESMALMERMAREGHLDEDLVVLLKEAVASGDIP